MGLFKEPMLRALLVLVLVTAGALWLSLETTRDYLQRQMQAQTQDSATSLALAMQPVLTEEDLLTAETVITALVQTGNYESVSLQSAAGDMLVQQEAAKIQPLVPDLFMRGFPLTPPEASAPVSLGWDIAARVTITGTSALAYQQLWHLALSILGLGAACMALATGLLWQWARGKQRLLDQRFDELGHVIAELRSLSAPGTEELMRQFPLFDEEEPPQKSQKPLDKKQTGKQQPNKKQAKKKRWQELAT